MKLVPLILGYTAADLWDSINLVLVTWALLIFLPSWRMTPTLTLVSPMIHSFIYLASMVTLISSTPADQQMDFTSLKGVVKGFQDPNNVFVGWIHYIAFDALVGRMIVLDSVERRASWTFHFFAVVPCLIFTFLLGPVGFFCYMILKRIFLEQPAKNSKKML